MEAARARQASARMTVAEQLIRGQRAFELLRELIEHDHEPGAVARAREFLSMWPNVGKTNARRPRRANPGIRIDRGIRIGRRVVAVHYLRPGSRDLWVHRFDGPHDPVVPVVGLKDGSILLPRVTAPLWGEA